MTLWIVLACSVGISLGAGASYLFTAHRLRRSSLKVQVAHKRAHAAEHLAEIGSMTGGLAHEIKNPLSTIGLNAQLLSEAIEDLPIDDQDQNRLVRRIDALSRETDRLRGILEDFLEYAGELRLSRSRVNMNTLIEELVDFFSPMATGAETRLRVEPDPKDPIANVDSNHIKQAVLNLMLNALHAMEENEPDKPRELIVRIQQDIDPAHEEAVVKIHVIDTGPGMNEETRSQIFRPYFTTKSGGTGLGLPTARRIIQAHHGQLELHSEPGRGTDFVVTIPLEDQ